MTPILLFTLHPLGCYLSVQLHLDEDIHIVDMEMDRRSFHDLISLYRPDLVCVTMSATEHNSGLQLAKIAKANGAATIVGGYHPTGVPDLMLSYPEIDMVVRGEGEIT